MKCQQDDLHRFQAECEVAGQPDHRQRDGGDGQADRCHGRPQGEVETDLHRSRRALLTAAMVSGQYHQGDDDADDCIGQAESGDGVVMVGENSFARPTTETRAARQKAEAFQA